MVMVMVMAVEDGDSNGESSSVVWLVMAVGWQGRGLSERG